MAQSLAPRRAHRGAGGLDLVTNAGAPAPARCVDRERGRGPGGVTTAAVNVDASARRPERRAIVPRFSPSSRPRGTSSTTTPGNHL